MKYLLCFIGFHSYIEQPRSFKPTGKKTISWAGKVVNEYQSKKACKYCDKSKIEKWIIYGE